MSTAKKIILAVVGGIVGVGVILGVLAWLFMARPAGNIITEEEAKAIAFTHADVEEADTRLLNIKLDMEDLQRIYDVKFYVGNAEYQYEINAVTGHIDDFDVEGLREQAQIQTEAGVTEGQVETPVEIPTNEQVDVPMPEAKISEGEVTKIIAGKIPSVVDSNIWFKLDLEDGRLIYEGKAIHDGMEYEFDIDANDGTILSWEVEKVDADDIPVSSSHTQSQHHNQ